ncbi:hypothetical protein OQA88_13074 [Cercophora sp. LCS_1]
MDHPIIPLLTTLMSTPSTTAHESPIGLLLQSHLLSLGYTVERIPIAPSSPRHNIYAYLGSSRQTRILLTAHMDTVSPHIPPTISPNRIHGRGSSDDLGPLAAQIFAFESLRSSGQIAEGDVALLFVVGEENGGAGMIAANEMGITWEAGIFAEPTESMLARGHKGQVAFEVTVQGKACHSGYPERGKSATSTLVKLLGELERQEWGVCEVLGHATFNIGAVEGGEAHNIVAGRARAVCEVRVVDGGLDDTTKKVERIVGGYEGVELKWMFEYPEVMLEWEIEGFESQAVAFGTDVPRLKEDLCGRRVLYGPGSILVAHGPDEFIAVDELVESIEGYKKLVLHFLK